MEYINRIVDKEIETQLSVMGAVLVRGCKWCGKTTSCKRIAKSVLELQDPSNQDRYLSILNNKPSLLLDGEKPLLIDEWQIAPKIWNAIRYSVDSSGEVGQYLLTGSATPVEDDTLHSGAGRFAFVDMKPLSLYESGESNGLISIRDLLNGKDDIDGIKTDLTYERTAFALCRGGWPSTINMEKDKAVLVAKNYIKAVVNSDISRVDGVSRDPDLAMAILRAYARATSTVSADQTIYDDVSANFKNVDRKTIDSYLNALSKLFIIENIGAWNPNIRSKTAMRTSPKKNWVDPSLATAVLDLSPNDLMRDPETFGLLFENMVERDLSIYVRSLGGKLNYYRDRYGLECDSVIHFDNGKYALVEIKLGSSKNIEEGAQHLNTLKDLILEHQPRIGAPAFMMVVTDLDIAYKTESGVLVIPIGCLKD